MTSFDSFPRVSKDSPFQVPEKKINSDFDVTRFNASTAFDRIVGFILLLNESIKGKTCLDEDIILNDSIKAVGEVLDTLNGYLDEIPPSTGPRRFGNIAFRDWIRRLEERAPELLRQHLPEDCHPALVEITPYLTGAFGSGQRLDYGTGHELSFCAFLCTLFLLRTLDPSTDCIATALVIFPKYFNLIRRLVETYTLEPAGSHGVWGLDDTSFLPFLLGSGQYVDQPSAPPTASIMQPEVIQTQKDKNLYFAAIAWINRVLFPYLSILIDGQMKKGPFFEHSPTLYDISAVPYWGKINKGMVKMYKAEVLGKFPVIQHFPIGKVFFTLDEATSTIPATSMGPPRMTSQ